MDLPNFFSSSNQDGDANLVLCVMLSQKQAQAVLVRFSTSGVHIRAVSTKKIYHNLEEVVTRVDEALSELGKEAEGIVEVIFAVPSEWVESGDLAPVAKPIAQHITQELSLKPLGFVDMTEVIVQQLVAQNGLYTGLVLCVSEHSLSFALLSQGKSKGIETVGASADFSSDFAEMLARVQKTAQQHSLFLPSEMVLATFDLPEETVREFQQQAYDLQSQKEQAVGQPLAINTWSEEDFLDSVAREVGKATAVQKGLTKVAAASSVASTPRQKNLQSEDFETAELPTSFGVPIAATSQHVLEIAEKEVDSIVATELAEIDKKKARSKKTMIFIAAGFLLGIIVLVLSVFVVIPAITTVEVLVTPKKVLVTKDVAVFLDPELAESDPETLTIAASKVTELGSLESTLQTTGVKVVGEKAAGTVTIYNKSTAGAKIFPKGTVLKNGSLEFELEEEVQVASATAKPNGTDYGKSEVKVVARQIGAESNLPKDSELMIVPYDTSTYNAFVKDPGLAGGSSREIRVVAQKDIDELLQDSREELLENMNEDISDSLPEGSYAVPSQVITKESATFSAELEDQAESLTIELELELEFITYSGSQLKPFASKVLAGEIPENHVLEDKDPEILFDATSVEAEEGTASTQSKFAIDISMSAFAIPQLVSDELRAEIVNKHPQEAAAILSAKSEIAKVQIVTKPEFASKIIRAIQDSPEKTQVTILD